MKQTLLFIFILTLAATAFAQPPNSRLDADLKRLNRRFESVESIKRLPVDGNTEVRIKRSIESAERELGRFKKKYPTQNTNKFEKALVGFKNPRSISSSSPAEVSDFAKVENFVETIDEILKFSVGSSKLIRGEESAIAEAKQQVKDFQTKMQKTITSKFLALAKDLENRKIKRISDKANNLAKSMETDLSNIDIQRIRDETDQGVMLMRYLRVLSIQEKLSQLTKIYGDNSNIKLANVAASKVISQLGSIEDIEKLGEKNYAAKVARNRMSPERQKNPTLKKEFINAFKGSPFRINDVSKNSTILKVHLVNNGWGVQRNKITGIIISRDQQAQIAFKATNGKCYTYLALMKQNHDGGGKYGRAIEQSGSQSEILCTNVPK